MIRIRRDRITNSNTAGTLGTTLVKYTVIEARQIGSVNFRQIPLWRPDNRYPGYTFVRRHESGGIELSFDAIRHGAKPKPPIVIAPEHVDHFILSCLEVRDYGD